MRRRDIIASTGTKDRTAHRTSTPTRVRVATVAPFDKSDYFGAKLNGTKTQTPMWAENDSKVALFNIPCSHTDRENISKDMAIVRTKPFAKIGT